MPGYTEKSREYLCRAVEHEQRAANALDPKLKETFLGIARGYRRLAEQLDARWRPPLTTRLPNRKVYSAA
jgi:hypothetical protein